MTYRGININPDTMQVYDGLGWRGYESLSFTSPVGEARIDTIGLLNLRLNTLGNALLRSEGGDVEVTSSGTDGGLVRINSSGSTGSAGILIDSNSGGTSGDIVVKQGSSSTASGDIKFNFETTGGTQGMMYVETDPNGGQGPVYEVLSYGVGI